MRALVCSELSGIDGLELGELPEPALGLGTVRVAVEASGVNFADALVVEGRYQVKPPLPFAPGLEIAGRVIEVASDVDRIVLGDRVYGFVPWGGFAEQAVVAATSLVAIPDGMAAETAAALPVAYGTGYHALVDRAQLRRDETLLVLGAAGGVGIAAVQIGSALAARVIAVVSSVEKEDLVRTAGATDVIRYDRTQLRDSLKEIAPDGVDVVFDPVGGDSTEPAFRSTAWRGRHLVVGFAAGPIPSLPLNLALLKGSSLVGVFWGRFAEMEPEANLANFEILNQWWAEGRIDPVISEVFPLGGAVEALERIAARRALGKLIIRP